jgi:glycosyltransferase involved in cell wall biosynthesis
MDQQRSVVSIILTTLNCARFLPESIDSCLEQTYSNIELIIVDGGSTDGTLEIVAGYIDPRLRLIHQPGNTGKLPGALNLGLEQALGEYLTWMQGDSRYHPQAIDKMVAILEEQPNIGQVYANFNVIDPDGTFREAINLPEPETFLSRIGDPGGVCFLIRRSVRQKVGLHDLNAYPSQDFDYRMRIAVCYESYHLKESLYDWRDHSDSLTNTLGWLLVAKKDIEIRQRLALDTPQQSKRRLAEVYMAYAFECYNTGKFHLVLTNIVPAIYRYPAYMKNRGVWSILVRSLFKSFNKNTTDDNN